MMRTRDVVMGLGAVGLVGAVFAVAASTSRAAPLTQGTSAPVSSAVARQAYLDKHAEAAKDGAQAFDDSLARYTAGTGTLDEAIQWSVRTHEADYGPNAAADQRDRMVKLEKAVTKKVASGAATTMDAHVVAYYRALAEAAAP